MKFICVALYMHEENELESCLETILLNFHPVLIQLSRAAAVKV